MTATFAPRSVPGEKRASRVISLIVCGLAACNSRESRPAVQRPDRAWAGSRNTVDSVGQARSVRRPAVVSDYRVDWVVQLGGDSCDAPLGVAADREGNVYLYLQFLQRTRLLGTSINSAGDAHLAVAKLSGEGKILWVTPVVTTGEDIGDHITLVSERQVAISGSLGSSWVVEGNSHRSGAFIALLGTGSGMITRVHSDPGLMDFDEVQVESSGGLVVTGHMFAPEGSRANGEIATMVLRGFTADLRPTWATTILDLSAKASVAISPGGQIEAFGPLVRPNGRSATYALREWDEHGSTLGSGMELEGLDLRDWHLFRTETTLALAGSFRSQIPSGRSTMKAIGGLDGFVLPLGKEAAEGVRLGGSRDERLFDVASVGRRTWVVGTSESPAVAGIHVGADRLPKVFVAEIMDGRLLWATPVGSEGENLVLAAGGDDSIVLAYRFERPTQVGGRRYDPADSCGDVLMVRLVPNSSQF